MEKEDIDVKMAELETRLERLRSLYEQYFLGIERIEPGVPRKDVERRFADLRRVRFHSTAQRFKFQTIVQRYNTMQQYWNRTCREIELGTYRRHKLKAERSMAAADAEDLRRARRAAPEETTGRSTDAREAAEADLRSLLEEDLDMGAALDDALRGLQEQPADAKGPAPPVSPITPASGANLLARLKGGETSPGASLSRALASSLAPQLRLSSPTPLASSPDGPRPPAPRPAAPAAHPGTPAATTTQPQGREPRRAGAAPPAATKPDASSDRLPEDRVREIHRAYVQAREKTNAKTVSFEKLEKSLRETEAKLRAQHQGRHVDFDVQVKDGKAILKPKLK